MTIQIRSSSAKRAVYLCYGSDSHTLRIEGAEDSPWVSQGVSLNHASADSPLIFADPGYGELQKLEPEGSEWKLRCPADGIDHDFEYSIQSEFTAVPYKISMRLGHYRREVLDSRSPISAPVIGDTVKAQITVGSFYTKQALENIEVKWSIGGTTTTVPTSTSGVSQFTHTVQTLGEQTITAEFYSPYDDKTVSESFEIKVYETSPWEDAKLYVNDREVMWGDPIGLTRGRANALRVEVAPEIAKVLRLGVGESGGLNLASNPPFESDVNPVGETFNWTVTPDDGLSGLGMLVLFSTDVVLPWELPFWVMSRNLADEADVLIGGNIVPPEGIDFKHLQPQVLTLRYKTDSPLPGHPVKLKCRIVEGLEEGSLPSEPDYGEEQTTHRWTMTGLRGVGKFQLSLAGNNMTSELVVPVCHLLEGGVPDYFTVQFDGSSLKPGDKAHATRYGRHTITLIPKSGAPDNKVKLDWGIEAPDGVTMTPAPGVSQAVHPTEGATWELRCLGVDAEFSVKAEWEGASLTALETPVSLKAGTYNMRFKFLDILMPYPPTEVLAAELIPGAGWGVQPAVQVTTQEGVPVAGVNVEFITPDHPVGFGTTNATGGAGSSVAIKYYPKERHVIELLAKTTEATGRVSMIRLLLLLFPANA